MFLLVLCALLQQLPQGNAQCGNAFTAFTANDQTCTVPQTQFCECVCNTIDGYNGYIGWQGGAVPQMARYYEDACGTKASYNSASYPTYECHFHCAYDARATLCMGNGVPDWGHSVFWPNAAGYFLDTQAATVPCMCDPGYYGARTLSMPCPAGDNICEDPQLTVRQHCYGEIRTDVCSGKGVDISKGSQPRGVGLCPTTYNPGAPPASIWPSTCSNSYSSIDPLANILCLCDIGFIGGAAGQLSGQCSQTVRNAVCSGRGDDSCSNCQYRASTPPYGSSNSPICVCDQFYGSPAVGTGFQCSIFLPCTFGCGGVGTCNTDNTACTCNPGYGSPACCPLQFGSATAVCGGLLSACQSNGQCNCPPGFQNPGCCANCDASQTCLIDGRCTCPVISGRVCGVYGTCISGSINTCTCRSAQTTLSDGTVTNATLGGLFCCPVLSGIGNKGVCGGGVCTSHSVAIDPTNPSTSQSGSCVCPLLSDNYLRQGIFCCPIVPSSQSVPCGQFGVCQPSGQCKCPPGFVGLACEINLNCDLSSTTECNGAGKCLPRTAGTYGLGDYLAELQFVDVAGVSYKTDDGVVIQDEGAVFFLREVYRAFLGFDPATASDESSYYQQGLAACQSAQGNRGQCLWNMLLACQPARDARIASTPGGIGQYLKNALAAIDPVASTQFAATPYEASLELAFSGNACAGQGQPREAMASLMLWDLWLYIYRTDPIIFPVDPARFTLNPSFVSAPWQCVCTPPAAGSIIGSDTAIGGTKCQFTTCPMGSNNQPCSGWSQGVFRGYCVDSGRCECSPRFTGHACEVSLTPGCYPAGSTDILPCSGHGSCTIASASNTSCSCQPQVTGKYCELSRCQAPGVPPQPGECNSFGTCDAVSLVCDCSSFVNGKYDTGSQSNPPVLLPTGNACEQNGQSACAIFVQNPAAPAGTGNWQVCSNHGKCIWNYTSSIASCVCSGNTFGPQCQNSACLPLCNGHQNCDVTTGACNCQRFWATPASCITPNRTCECTANLCGHGVPSADGTSCICSPGWKKAKVGPTAGMCTIVQCPLTVYTDQGVRPCIDGVDRLCTDLASTTESLSHGCCVDTCPSCNLDVASGTRTCDCSSLSGFAACYTQQNGICFPNCHGSDELLPNNPPNCDSTSVPGTLLCHCDFVILGPTQFRDLRCQRYTCANGGTPVGPVCNPQTQVCCNCAKTAYTGAFCSVSACGDFGTPAPNGTVCICTPPFYRSGAGPLCDANHCSPGSVVKSPLTGAFECNCPANTFAAKDGLSCRRLDCKGQDAPLCSQCKNNSTALLFAGQISCNCAGTSFTGTNCSVPVCQNGGSPNGDSCDCVAPFSGRFCVDVTCLNGGTAAVDHCVCPIEWTGSQCQVLSGRTAEKSNNNNTSTNTTNSSSSSSSSTGGNSVSSTGTSNTTVASPASSKALAIGLGTTAAVVGVAGTAYVVYTVMAARAAVTATIAAANATAGASNAPAAVAMAMTSARYDPLVSELAEYGEED